MARGTDAFTNKNACTKQVFDVFSIAWPLIGRNQKKRSIADGGSHCFFYHFCFTTNTYYTLQGV